MNNTKQVLVFVVCLMLFGTRAALGSCIVLGSQEAKVKTPEGVKYPAFSTLDCENLRLLSGQAKAIWVGKDGQPDAGALRSDDPPLGFPENLSGGSLKIFANVLQTLADSGFGLRSGHKRGVKRFDEVIEGGIVYVPPTGLVLPFYSSQETRVTVWADPDRRLLSQWMVAPQKRPIIMPTFLVPGVPLNVEVASGQGTYRLVLSALQTTVQAEVAQVVLTIDGIKHLTNQERAVMQAMFFDQRGLAFNRNASLDTAE